MGRKKPKPSLLSAIDAPLIKDEITPMGSVFNSVEPGTGITFIEQGKTKYGTMNTSRKALGQMTREEYNHQKEVSIAQNELHES
jgi:hypothetical protein